MSIKDELNKAVDERKEKDQELKKVYDLLDGQMSDLKAIGVDFFAFNDFYKSESAIEGYIKGSWWISRYVWKFSITCVEPGRFRMVAYRDPDFKYVHENTVDYEKVEAEMIKLCKSVKVASA